MPTVLLQGRETEDKKDSLCRHLTGDWRYLTWEAGRDDPARFAALAVEADAIVGGRLPPKPWPGLPRLKLVQITWTGYDALTPADFPAGVPVCNCYGHEAAIAEYVLLAMLEWKIRLRDMDRRFREKGWDGRDPGTSLRHGEIGGTTLGIVGYGPIGRAIALRARAFGVTVKAVRRQPQALPAELDWLGGTADLDDLLAVSDFVVLACALNDSTRGLIDARRLSLMKPDAVLINIARGAVVAEAALFEALQARRIGGAVLDVWYNYLEAGKPAVWPCNHPFEALDNVILSAHECGATAGESDRRWQDIAANLTRIASGEAPRNVIFTGAG